MSKLTFSTGSSAKNRLGRVLENFLVTSPSQKIWIDSSIEDMCAAYQLTVKTKPKPHRKILKMPRQFHCPVFSALKCVCFYESQGVFAFFLGDRDLANNHLNTVKFVVFYLTSFGWEVFTKEFPWL